MLSNCCCQVLYPVKSGIKELMKVEWGRDIDFMEYIYDQVDETA